MTNLIECSAAAYSCPLLIKNLLNSALIRAPEQEIVYRSQARFSYRDFRDRVGRLASGLTKLGVQSGDTVGVMDLDSHRYLECFFAVPMMGATLHTINVRLSPEQILYTINHAKDDVILVNGEFLPILEKIWDRVEGVKALVLLDDGGERAKTTLSLAADYETLLAGADPDFVFPDLDEDTRATTFYTTGTTGLPKGVYFSHRQLVLHTMALRNAITGTGHGRLNDGDVYMPVTPMFHVHAWGFPYVATALGLKQVYLGKYSPDLVLDLIAREKVTFSHCVPTILQMILAHPRAAEGMLNGWKVIVGGAALPRALAKEAMQRGIDITTGYGMSETCPVLTLAHLRPEHEAWDVDRQVEVRIKAGRPIPLVDIRVVDTEMRDVPADGHDAGRDRGASAVADAGLSARSRELGQAVARRMAAHRRHRHDRRRRLPQDHGSPQGRHQDRGRMGVIARHRGPHPQAPRRVRSRRHRHSGSEVDRTPARDRGPQGGLFGQRL